MNDTRANDDGTYVILVAVEVTASDRDEAMRLVVEKMPPFDYDAPRARRVECWWIAEDNRIDGSDNDPAVFVPLGEQDTWAQRVDAERNLSDLLPVALYEGGLEVAHPDPHGADERPAGALMFGVVTEESDDEYEEGCYDYVLGHWPDGEEWVELARWPHDWDIAASMRGQA